MHSPYFVERPCFHGSQGDIDHFIGRSLSGWFSSQSWRIADFADGISTLVSHLPYSHSGLTAGSVPGARRCVVSSDEFKP